MFTNCVCGEGNGSPLQYSCLENPVDSGAWWAVVHGVAQSRTWLKQLSMHACIGEGNGNPLQYFCLENPRDIGAWWAAISEVAQSRTRLKWLSSSSSNCIWGSEKEGTAGWRDTIGKVEWIFFFSFIFISWRLITLQYCGFCRTLTWINHGFTCVPHWSEYFSKLKIINLEKWLQIVVLVSFIAATLCL